MAATAATAADVGDQPWVPLNAAHLDRWCAQFLGSRDCGRCSLEPPRMPALANPALQLSVRAHGEFVATTSRQWQNVRGAQVEAAKATAALKTDSFAGFHEALRSLRLGPGGEPAPVPVSDNLVALYAHAVLHGAVTGNEAAPNALAHVQKLRADRPGDPSDTWQPLCAVAVQLVLAPARGQAEAAKMVLEPKERDRRCEALVNALLLTDTSGAAREAQALTLALAYLSMSSDLYETAVGTHLGAEPPLGPSFGELGACRALESLVPRASRAAATAAATSRRPANASPSPDRKRCRETQVYRLADLTASSLRDARRLLAAAQPGVEPFFYHSTAYVREASSPAAAGRFSAHAVFRALEKEIAEAQRDPLVAIKCLRSCDSAHSRFPLGLKPGRWYFDSATSPYQEALRGIAGEIPVDADRVSALAALHLASRGMHCCCTSSAGVAASVIDETQRRRRLLLECLPDPQIFTSGEAEGRLTQYRDALGTKSLVSCAQAGTDSIVDSGAPSAPVTHISFQTPESTPLARLTIASRECLQRHAPSFRLRVELVLLWLQAIEYALLASFHAGQRSGTATGGSLAEQTSPELERPNGIDADAWWNAALVILREQLGPMAANRPFLQDRVRELLAPVALRQPLADTLAGLFHQHRRVYQLAASLVDNYVLAMEPGTWDTLGEVLRGALVIEDTVQRILPDADLASAFQLCQLSDDSQVALIANQLVFSRDSASASAFPAVSAVPPVRTPVRLTQSAPFDVNRLQLARREAAQRFVPLQYVRSAGLSWAGIANYAVYSPLFSPFVAVRECTHPALRTRIHAKTRTLLGALGGAAVDPVALAVNAPATACKAPQPPQRTLRDYFATVGGSGATRAAPVRASSLQGGRGAVGSGGLAQFAELALASALGDPLPDPAALSLVDPSAETEEDLSDDLFDVPAGDSPNRAGAFGSHSDHVNPQLLALRRFLEYRPSEARGGQGDGMGFSGDEPEDGLLEDAAFDQFPHRRRRRRREPDVNVFRLLSVLDEQVSGASAGRSAARGSTDSSSSRYADAAERFISALLGGGSL